MNFLKKIDRFLDQHLVLLLLLLLMVLLRIPNFFEPYWYGDEAIYLTIGNSLNQGAKLYTDIIDHKTPLIYFFAMVGTQFNFRLLLLGWMLVTTTLFYKLVKKITLGKYSAPVATLLFILITTLPWFEGNIPNGELFVLGFIIASLYSLSFTNYFKNYFAIEKTKTKENWLLFILSSCLAGLGVLTKVPAILDLAAIMMIGALTTTEKLLLNLTKKNKFFKLDSLLPAGQAILWFLLSLVPIALSILFFIAIGSGKDYLDYGLLYNFRYAQSWQLPFNNNLLNLIFGFKGKTLVLALLLSGLILLNKKLSRLMRFALSWFYLTFFASLLSNRPYPHYYLQLTPSFCLLITGMLRNIYGIFKTKMSYRIHKQVVMDVLAACLAIYLATTVLLKFNLGLYPTVSYYQKFWQLITKKINRFEYETSFNGIIADNYQAAQIIKQAGTDRYFIWGTNPMLYALTQTRPIGRFTVAFHIRDFNYYSQTMEFIKQVSPKTIVVMKNEENFSELNDYLQQFYRPNYALEHMTIYLKK